MIDPRLIGRSAVAEVVTDLARDRPRWILCSRDFARDAVVSDLIAYANPSIGGGYVSSQFPVELCLDGNRQSWCETSLTTEYLEFTLDLGLGRRKALLFLEYPAGDQLEVLKLSWTNDAGAAADSSLTAKWFVMLDKTLSKNPVTLFEGRNYCLLELPWNQVSTGASSPENRALTYATDAGSPQVRLAEEIAEAGWVGGYVIPQSGSCSGQPRRIVSYSIASGTTTYFLDDSWPVVVPVGTVMRLVRYDGAGVESQYLGNRYCRIRLARKVNVGLEPIRILGLSLFDFELVLNGGNPGFREIAAGNPSEVGRGHDAAGDPTGIVHRGLNGRVRFEQPPLGPKRVLRAAWSSAYSGWFDVLESYCGRGNVGLVDEHSRYMQGYFAKPSSTSRKTDAQGKMRAGVNVEFTET